jgi:tetratricopeptide (TPR) repeat protein
MFYLVLLFMAEPSARDYIRLSYAIGLREAGDVKPAGNLLRQLLATPRLPNPYRASALTELGITETLQGRGREASRFAGEALAIPLPDAQRLHALVAAGHIAYSFRNRKRARIYFEQARQLAGHSLTAGHPELGPLHSGLGLLNDDDGNPDEAEKHYREALRIA